MENPLFFGNEKIPQVTHKEVNHELDYKNDQDVTIKRDQAGSTDKQSTLTLRLRQKAKRDKLTAMHRELKQMI